LNAIWILLVALAYASVGHGGASGFLALMALLGTPTSQMRPSALILNILVASIAALMFVRAKPLAKSNQLTLALLCLGSVPCAFFGGRFTLPTALFEALLAGFFAISALQLLRPVQSHAAADQLRSLPKISALALGAALGLLAGLTGIGGGVLLSPILVLGRFASLRHTAAMSAIFIVLNSSAGLLALHMRDAIALPVDFSIWLAAGALGACIGARIGSVWLPPLAMRVALAAVLLLAALRLAA
jgi:uncharacterized protein